MATSTSPSYDLTAKIAAHLDPHMILPLLDFAEANGSFDRHTLNRARLQILQQTQMVDFFNDIYVDEFGDDEPHDGLNSRPRDSIVDQYTKLKANCASLLELLDERKGDIGDRSHLTAASILENRPIDPAEIEALYAYAKFLFDCGQYQDAAEFLFFYRILSSNDERCFKALWGQLAADILLTHWDDALVGLNQLSDSIDQMANATQISLVKYRSWLIHWGLFVFFNHQNGRASLIEFLNKERNLITIQTSCPHILRYVVTAAIIRRRRNALLDLVKLVSKLAYLYSDPITQFLQALYVQYDFATAFAKLGECDRVLTDDFFLSYIKDEFIDSARLFYFETYFRAHQTISIQQVAESLGVGMDEAERWTVDLIRSLGLEARIDLHKNEVVMAKEFPSVYQSVIDKTKSLSFRTNQLVSLVDKKYLSLQE